MVWACCPAVIRASVRVSFTMATTPSAIRALTRSRDPGVCRAGAGESTERDCQNRKSDACSTRTVRGHSWQPSPSLRRPSTPPKPELLPTISRNKPRAKSRGGGDTSSPLAAAAERGGRDTGPTTRPAAAVAQLAAMPFGRTAAGANRNINDTIPHPEKKARREGPENRAVSGAPRSRAGGATRSAGF